MITLYNYAMSPYGWKVHCFLQYKRLPFECVYINPLRRREQLPCGIQVPVVRIGDDVRADSTPIGVWLDERFPDQPRLLPDDGPDRDAVLALDRWISHTLIPNTFRTFPGTSWNARRVRNAWRLAEVMHLTAHGGLPWPIRAIWPVVLWRLGFVRRVTAMTSLSNAEVLAQLRAHLGDGPYLGGRPTPSLADLAAYPQLVGPYVAGLRGEHAWLDDAVLREWIGRVGSHLHEAPPLIPRIARRRVLSASEVPVDATSPTLAAARHRRPRASP